MIEARLIHAAEGGDRMQARTKGLGGAPALIAAARADEAGGPAIAMALADRSMQIRRTLLS